MNEVFPTWGLLLVQSLGMGSAVGAVTLVVLAIRAALEGRMGVSFADLWTALAVGVVIAGLSAAVPFVMLRLAMRRFRVDTSPSSGWFRAHTADGGGQIESGPVGFGDFDEDGRRVLVLAQDEAARFNHTYIGTEHLLLALARDSSGAAAKILRNLGADLGQLREAVEATVGSGMPRGGGELGLTPRAKRVIELAMEEANRLHAGAVGSEHFLLALALEGQGVAAVVLTATSISYGQIDAELRHGGSDPNPGATS